MKKASFYLVIAVVVMALSGCMSADNRFTATPQPAPMSSPAVSNEPPLTGESGAVPQGNTNGMASVAPDSTAGTQSGMQSGAQSGAQSGMQSAAPATSFDWAKQTSRVTDSLNQISELAMSYIVVEGDDALVGVTYDSAYKGGLTERLKDMVKQRLLALDSSLDDIYVTDNPELVTRISALSEELSNGATIDRLKPEFDAIEEQLD